MLTIQTMVEAISLRAIGRYEVSLLQTFDLVQTSIEVDSKTLQLRRINRDGAGWKTVLIVAFPYDLEKIKDSFRWAADVRDNLAEPQTADLYMFMLIEGIESEDAARLETDDRFCRKIVVREGEDVDSFLNRGFLAPLSPASSSENINDPLLVSLNALVKAHSWVDSNMWRELLLSGRAGSEIAEDLKALVLDDESSK
ncbi:ABC-three component system middle component 1 [Marinomonas lutimaris]|uniref:ABC-three component system middle component 1 n=1 Tax=Marinomonas lutimaris TaxID=2846746 RepID=UPI001CA48494|nr:ABC-three component system middle component 1 [Marinomonas lutimaris]